MSSTLLLSTRDTNVETWRKLCEGDRRMPNSRLTRNTAMLYPDCCKISCNCEDIEAREVCSAQICPSLDEAESDCQVSMHGGQELIFPIPGTKSLIECACRPAQLHFHCSMRQNNESSIAVPSIFLINRKDVIEE